MVTPFGVAADHYCKASQLLCDHDDFLVGRHWFGRLRNCQKGEGEDHAAISA